MKLWEPIHVIILIMAVTLTVILLLVVILIYLKGDSLLVGENAKLFAGLLTTMLSIISMYVGAQIQKKVDKE